MRKLKIFLIYVTVFILVLQATFITAFVNPARAKAATPTAQIFYATDSSGSSGTNHGNIKGAPDNVYAV